MLNEQQKQLLETVQAQIAAGQHLVLGEMGSWRFQMEADLLSEDDLNDYGMSQLVETSKRLAAKFGNAERIAALEQQLAQALARVGVLEAALKPFAMAATHSDVRSIDIRPYCVQAELRVPPRNLMIPLVCGMAQDDYILYLTLEEFNNAAAALKGDSNA